MAVREAFGDMGMQQVMLRTGIRVAQSDMYREPAVVFQNLVYQALD